MRVGHAEADFIVSGKEGKGILLVVVDRKLRAVFLEQILIVTIGAVHRAFVRIKKRYPELQTFTTDNDILFQHHRELARLLGVKIYFCHPYHSWEKGSVENVNGVIRKTIPKGSDLSQHSKRFMRSMTTTTGIIRFSGRPNSTMQNTAGGRTSCSETLRP